jgi:hypothetical protein
MIAAHRDNWFDLLEASCAQVPTSFLDIIIDQAGSDAPWLSSVLSVDPTMPSYSLFTGLPEEGAEDLAPLLVRVDLEQPMQRQWLIGLIRELGNRSQLLALASHWPFPMLTKHLGRCLDAANGGRIGLLRYYDPRLFPVLFSHVLEPEQQQQWLRPAVFWSWLDLDGAPHRLLGKPEMPVTTDEHHVIELSDDQLETLGCASDAIAAMSNLEEALPADWSVQQRFQACYAAMLEATQAGLLVAAQREAFTLDRLRTA